MSKHLITILVLLFFGSSLANAEIFYCSANGNGGFDMNNNLSGIKYELRRFKVKIDISKPFIEGKEIYLIPAYNPICRYTKFGKNKDTIYCSTDGGDAFSFNTKTNRYIYANTFLTSNLTDTSKIEWGTCENF